MVRAHKGLLIGKAHCSTRVLARTMQYQIYLQACMHTALVYRSLHYM
jgi:hypothetical protein